LPPDDTAWDELAMKRGEREHKRGRAVKGPLESAIVLMCLAFFCFAARAAEPKPVWTVWERSHAVATEKDWMVIDPPGASACYMKQSYPDPEKMAVSLIRDGKLLVCGPFYHQGRGGARLTCRFRPGGKTRTLERSEVSNCIALPRDFLPGFKSKYTVHVRVVLPDRNNRTLDQEFSLMGFTAAHEALQSGVCSKE